MKPGWTERNLQTPSENIDDFKSEARRVFANYQPSRMGTMKFHLLEYITEDVL